MLLGILGILLSLGLLITLAYRGMPVIVAAPISSAVVLLFSGAPLLPASTPGSATASPPGTWPW